MASDHDSPFVAAPTAPEGEPVVLGAVEPSSSPEPAKEGDDASQEAQGRSDAERLLKIVVELAFAGQAVPFHTPDDQRAYITVPARGRSLTIPVVSPELESWLIAQFLDKHKSAPSAQGVERAVRTLEAIAVHKGHQEAVHLRLAGGDGAIYVDLADEAGSVVEITAAGWRTTKTPPVRFYRSGEMRALPVPAEGGTIEDLRPFLNLPHEDDWILAVGWLLGALRPRGPYAMLDLCGEQGSGKSTTAAVLSAILDPSCVGGTGAPKDERDLFVAARHGRVLVFDNLSGIKPWMSDALCRLSDGSGYRTRMNYTDAKQVVFSGARPIIINGIEPNATRSDLLHRSITLVVPRLEDHKRRSPQQFWDAFNAALPRILGALLKAVSIALAGESRVELDWRPRNVDLARWVTAAEPALGWKPGTFVAACRRRQLEANTIPLEASPVPAALWNLLECQHGSWQGSATELLDQMEVLLAERIPGDWPRNATQLGKELSRLTPNLRTAGISIERGKEANRGRGRLWVLRQAKHAADAKADRDADTCGQVADTCPRPTENGAGGPENAVAPAHSARVDTSDRCILPIGEKREGNRDTEYETAA